MPRVGRPPTCDCGECLKCKRRVYMRKWYRAKSLEERQAIIAARDRAKVRAADRARYRRHRKQRLELQREYSQTAAGRAATAKGRRNYRERYPEKARAHDALGNAVRDGRVEKGPCEVGCDCAGPINAHHEDYSRPLDVRWLCRKHHLAEHGAEWLRAA